MVDALRELAEELGIEPGYHDVRGAWHEPTEEALLALAGVLGWPLARPDDAVDALAGLRAERASRIVDPVLLVPEGRARRLDLAGLPTDVALTLEDGTEVGVGVPPGGPPDVARSIELGPLPVGYHRLQVVTAAGEGDATVVVHPSTVVTPPRGVREWGVFAPLYGLRGEPSYADLDALGAWVAGLGGTVVGTLPLLPTFPWDPSPYQPISRRSWSSRFAAVGGDVSAPTPVPDPPPWDPADPIGSLAAWGIRGPRSDAVARWAAARPGEIELARFRACAELVGGGWRHAGFEWDVDERRIAARAGRFLVEQHLADVQLRAVADGFEARGQRLYLDLPLGCHPDGYDTWTSPELFARGASAGAPPDEFFSGGQDWGFPPVLPEASRAEGHLQLRQCLSHHMAVAGMLRVDHVMQLHRLFWIPEGADGSHGAYVRAPREELFAVLAIESRRHDCIVVGEDLGTVPDAVREAMAEHDMSGMWVAEFAMDPWPGAELRLPGERSVASVDTHDTPTFAGWRRERDLDLLDALGLLDHDAAVVARSDRHQQVENLTGWLVARGHLSEADLDDDAALHAALLEAMGETMAEIVLVTLEDLWGETEPQNVPGTPADRPNWVQRLRVPVDRLPGYEPAERVLHRLHLARTSGGGARP